MTKLIEDRIMNIAELRDVVRAVAIAETQADAPLTLYSKNGSMGEDDQTVTVDVYGKPGPEGEDNPAIFSGKPDCVGYDARSNYAHTEPYIVAPTGSIHNWVQDNYPTAFWYLVNFSTWKRWDRNPQERCTTGASFRVQAGMASIFTLISVEEFIATNGDTTTVKITAGIDCDCSITAETVYADNNTSKTD
jgi:hypothetical protein